MRTVSFFAIIFSTFVIATAFADEATPRPRSGRAFLGGGDATVAHATPAPRPVVGGTAPGAYIDDYSRGADEAITKERRQNGGRAGFGAFNTTYTWSVSDRKPDGSRKTQAEIQKERETANTVPEYAFGHNTSRSIAASHVNSGQDLLEDMAKYSAEHGCISNLTIATHGWDETPYPTGGDGIPMVTNYAGAGLYLDDATRTANHGPYTQGSQKSGRILSDLLEPQTFVAGSAGNESHKTGKIKFCRPYCHIQIMGCNTGDKFAKEFARVSKCEIVYASGRMNVADTNDGSGDFKWHGDAANGNKRDGQFFKVTPVVSASGEVRTVTTSMGHDYHAQ